MCQEEDNIREPGLGTSKVIDNGLEDCMLEHETAIISTRIKLDVKSMR